MRTTERLLLTALIGVGACLGAAKSSQFSGTWKMDAERSESAHQEVPVVASTVTIQMGDSDVTLETLRDDSGKPGAFHEKLYVRLDGTETTGTGDAGVEVTAKARWDKDKLVVETARVINEATVTTQYAYSVSPDGKKLTVEKTLSVQHGYQGRAGNNTGRGVDVFVKAK